jgi:two-component system LytT family sensor kinase
LRVLHEVAYRAFVTIARLRPWQIAAAFWLVALLLGPLSFFAQHQLYGESKWRLHDMLFSPSGIWLLCALVAPAFLIASRRWPFAGPKLARRAVLHVLVAALLWAVALQLYHGALPVLLDPQQRESLAQLPALVAVQQVTTRSLEMALNTLPLGFALYACIAGIDHASRYFGEARERELQMSRLSEQLTGARFAALQAQLNPHFLFNALNTIAVRARDGDGAGTARMVEQLSELLRRTLGRHRANEVTLDEELDLVREYLAIEEARFPDRLRPTFEIDASTRAAAVPSFAIQHLVENAIRHGITKRPGSGRLSIVARRERDTLVVSVTDDGAGITAGGENKQGHGLANTRERLHALHGEHASLELAASMDGTVATLRLPYRALTQEAELADG